MLFLELLSKNAQLKSSKTIVKIKLIVISKHVLDPIDK